MKLGNHEKRQQRDWTVQGSGEKEDPDFYTQLEPERPGSEGVYRYPGTSEGTEMKGIRLHTEARIHVRFPEYSMFIKILPACSSSSIFLGRAFAPDYLHQLVFNLVDSLPVAEIAGIDNLRHVCKQGKQKGPQVYLRIRRVDTPMDEVAEFKIRFAVL